MKYIKGLTLSLLLINGCSAYSPASTQTKAPSIKVHTCSFDFEDENFCDSAHLSLYKKTLMNGQINFNENYSISSSIEKSGLKSLAVINIKTGDTFLLEYTYGGYVDDSGKAISSKPSKLEFQLNSSKICIDGSVYAYQNTYQNQNTCFTFNGRDFELKENNILVSQSPKNIDLTKIKTIAIPTSWDKKGKKTSNWTKIDEIEGLKNWYKNQRKSSTSFPRLTEVSLLPNIGNTTVLIGRYIAETDNGNIYLYSLITINNNISKYVKLNENFWIDRNYLIKGVDNEEGKSTISYKISNDGTIARIGIK